MKYCVRCGAENKDDAKFCFNCGEKFIVEQSESNINNNFGGTNYSNRNDEMLYSPKKRGNLGKVSMILGIISVVMGLLCCCFPVGLPLGAVSVVLGIISLSKKPDRQKGMAYAGVILGAIALLAGLYMLICLPEIMETVMKELELTVQQTCEQNPYSDECQTYKEMFPEWFS